MNHLNQFVEDVLNEYRLQMKKLLPGYRLLQEDYSSFPSCDKFSIRIILKHSTYKDLLSIYVIAALFLIK